MSTQNPQAGLSAGPAVADGRVYVPDQIIDDTRFVVLDAKTGTQQWQYTNHKQQFLPSQTPTLVGDILYLVSGHAIDAVDLQKRTSRWHLELYDELNQQEGLTPPRVANGMVYVGADVGAVLAFDAGTGEQRWRHDVEGISEAKLSTVRNAGDTIVKARRQGRPYAPIAATENRVYVTSWDFSLYALDAQTGQRQWEFSLGSDHLDMMHAPVITDGKVYTQTENAILYVLDAETGEQRWTYDDYGKATDGVSPIVDDDSVYVIAGTSTENLFLVALDRADHSVRWKRQIGPTFVDPVADADTIYLDYGGGVHAIDKTDGTTNWTLHIQGELAAPVTIAGSAVFAADTAGHVYAVW
jgi:outer membrane protein assembly factor BamB